MMPNHPLPLTGARYKPLLTLVVCIGAALGTVLLPASATAQQPKQRAKAAADAKSGDAALRQRVEQLEEQLLDMQVMIGTLQSMSKTGGGRQAGPALAGPTGAGADTDRLRVLETQIQALTAQVEQLSQGGAGGRRSGLAGEPTSVVRPASGRFAVDGPVLRPGTAPVVGPVQGPSIGGFGSTTVIPEGDGIGQLLSRNQPAAGNPPREQQRLASRGGSSKQLYETAYGYLLQQNYGAAQTAFTEFLELYPSDPLAGDAQYWLGESLYVRRDYRNAASAFLRGYQNYGQGRKASDSLLKLAMALSRMGQKDSACSSFAEVEVRFAPPPPGELARMSPVARQHQQHLESIRKRAASERKRSGC